MFGLTDQVAAAWIGFGMGAVLCLAYLVVWALRRG